MYDPRYMSVIRFTFANDGMVRYSKVVDHTKTIHLEEVHTQPCLCMSSSFRLWGYSIHQLPMILVLNRPRKCLQFHCTSQRGRAFVLYVNTAGW